MESAQKGVQKKLWTPFLYIERQYLSGITLGAYLISWIFDTLIYDAAADHIPALLARQKWDPLLILSVFVCSMAVAALVDLVSRLIFFTAGKLGAALKKH